MKKECGCPVTVLYDDFMKKFKKGWEKAENTNKKCELSQFAGRISEKVFKKLEKDTKTKDEIGRGTVKELSVLFADIRGFTTRTADMSPDKIVTLLDLFIPEMLNIIMERHKGMIDKLLGDGIMALFGHPYQTGNETIQAIYSAVDMQQAAAAMGTVLKLMDYEPIEIGVGINTGPVLLCQVGGKNYKETTVIGAPVNLAAKMEDIALSHEIVLPENSVLIVEKQKPELMEYFEKKPERKHGVDAYNFDWIKFLNEKHNQEKDWAIIK